MRKEKEMRKKSLISFALLISITAVSLVRVYNFEDYLDSNSSMTAKRHSGNEVYYIAQDEDLLRRFVFNGTSWSLETVGIIGAPPWRGKRLELGDARNDGLNRVYVATDQIYEFTWNGSSWVREVISTLQPFAMDIGDADNDGIQEIYVGLSDSQVYQIRWNGSSWVSTLIGVVGWGSYPIVGDVEGHDGLNELYVNGHEFVQFKWNGSSWIWTKLGDTEQSYYGIELGDGDNDGKNEVYQMNANWPLYQYKWGISGWSKMGINDYFLPTYPEIGDPDDDGQNEVYVVRDPEGNSADSFKIYQHKWDGSSWIANVVDAPEIKRKAIGDGDNDGKQEIYAAGRYGTSILYQIKWNGNSWVTTELGNATSTQIECIVVGDGDQEHDIAISDVAPLKTVVGQGYSLHINVTVENQGDYTETFNVTAYADGSGWVRDTVTGSYGEAVVGTGTALYIARDTSFYRYLPADNSWTEMASPPKPDGTSFKTGTALAWDFGNYIYALYGAATGESRRWFYRYSISANSWEALANTTYDQGEGDTITWFGIYNCIYATIGGEERPTHFMVYFPSVNLWLDEPPADPPAGMGDGASLVWTGGDYLYALRGEFLETSPLYDFWRYDITSDTWTAMADIPAEPYSGGVGGVGDGGSLLYVGFWLSDQTDHIYALSGNQAHPDGIPDNRTYRYTISTNSWERLPDLPFGVGYYVGCRLGYADECIYAWQGAPSTWAGGGNDLARYQLIPIIVETKEVTLSSGNIITLTFTWNTTGVAKGNYTITAEATQLPGETDTADNTYTNGIVTIAMAGDLNADGTVDIFDIVIVASQFGRPIDPPLPIELPDADITNDGIVDIFDLVIVAAYFGQTDP